MATLSPAPRPPARRSVWKRVLCRNLHPAPADARLVLGDGVHLLLREAGADGPPFHLHLALGSDQARGGCAFSIPAGPTVARFTGDRLSPAEDAWLRQVHTNLLAVVREGAGARWEAFLRDAMTRRDHLSLPARDVEGRATSGQDALVRVHEPCNAACDFCSCIGEMPDYAISLEQVRTTLATHREAGATSVTFTGGEPTLRRDLPQLVALARDLGFTSIGLQTNGHRLARPDQVAALVQAGLGSVFLSLHAHTAEVHDRLLRAPGAFERAVAAVDALLAHGVQVRLNHVLQRDNVDDAAVFARWVVARFGAAVQITWSVISPIGRTLQHLDLLPRLAEVRGPLQEALDVCVQAGIACDVPGLCGMPMCVLPARYRPLFAEHADPNPPPRLPTRAHPPGCAACSLRERCSGYWTVYLERHGDHELRPVPA